MLQMGQFQDDSECSRLRTLFAHYPPGHVLYERRGLHPHTQHLIKLLLPGCVKDALVPGMHMLNCSEHTRAFLLTTDAEFWGSAKTLKVLAEGGYFEEDGKSKGALRWPPSLEAVLGMND